MSEARRDFDAMIFKATKLSGAFIIVLEPAEDERGLFARSFCEKEFETHCIAARFVQCNISFCKTKGTIRGLHYQAAPHKEAKLVRCTAGAIYDGLLNLRPPSPTFKQWESAELTAENHRALHIPEGLAHGFETLCDNCEVFYQMSEFYAPDCARGVRWNDPAFGIRWPEGPQTISIKDQSYSNFLE